MEDKEAYQNELVAHFFRHNYAKMVAVLVRYFGLHQVEVAEDIVQDTLVEAMEKWSIYAIPKNPEAWLMDVAKKKTINFLKRNQLFENKIRPSLQIDDFFESDESMQKDSTLLMIFACCHPALTAESQISLALKTLCGLSVSEIANALLTTESTINKRLFRAKQKFRKGTIAFHFPNPEELKERLESVFTTLYLLFNEGYYSSHHQSLIRMDLCFEAIRLMKNVLEYYPSSCEANALLALMYLSVARFESRIDEQGAIIILSDQDRSLWDKDLIAKGMEYLTRSTQSEQLSPYHLQAGIAAEHCLAKDFDATNWESIYYQYTLLERLQPNIHFSFNKSIAKFFGIHREEALLDLLDLEKEQTLQNNPHYYATLGIFYQEMDKKHKALPYFQKALSLSKSIKEKSLIEQKMNQ